MLIPPIAHALPRNFLGCGEFASSLPASDSVADELCSSGAVFCRATGFALGGSVVCHGRNLIAAFVYFKCMIAAPVESGCGPQFRRAKPFTPVMYQRGHLPGIGRRSVHSGNTFLCCRLPLGL